MFINEIEDVLIYDAYNYILPLIIVKLMRLVVIATFCFIRWIKSQTTKNREDTAKYNGQFWLP